MKLRTDDLIRLKTLYTKQIELFTYITTVNPNLIKYISSSKPSRNFFYLFTTGNEDNNSQDFFIFLVAKYEKELESIIESLGNTTYSDKEKLLNYLEYIRLNVCNENYKVDLDDFFDTAYMPNLSMTAFNSAILGKGVCSSQSGFLTDLLNYSNFTEYGTVSIKTILLPEGVRDVVVLGCEDETKAVVLDPKGYAGTVQSIKRVFSYKKNIYPEQKNNKLEITRENILNARKNALEYCIKKYRINSLIKKIGVENYSSTSDKADLIADYITFHKVNAKHEVDFDTVSIFGKEIECGKLFEMLCYASGIDYTIRCDDKSRDNTTYLITDTKCIYNFNSFNYSTSQTNNNYKKRILKKEERVNK